MNSDKGTNNNGHRLVELCKNCDLHIVNGRFGMDLKFGNLTCGGKSCVDYVISSPELFPMIENFSVDVFDPLLSDKHSPISLTLRVAAYQKCCNSLLEHNVRPLDMSCTQQRKRIVWEVEKKEVFLNSFDDDEIASIDSDLVNIDVNYFSQECMDKQIKRLNNLFLSNAEKIGIVKNCCMNRSKVKTKASNKWFNSDCSRAREDYFKCKRIHSKTRSDVTKNELKVMSIKYKRVLKNAKSTYYDALHNEIRNLKCSNPRMYWELINKASSNTKSVYPVNDIPIETFLAHFKNLHETCCENDDDSIPCPSPSSINEELNKPIDFSEVVNQIKKLSNNKAPGIDLIKNEFLMNSPVSVVNLITSLFNLVINTGIIPTTWTIGVVKPIFKGKGSPHDVDNYRGITLLSCLGKLFTAILNDRIHTYLQYAGILGDEQAGFRSNYSTIDHIFVLHTVIDLYQMKRSRLYCAFIDYKKAFDLVNQASLWLKLISYGINGKVLNVIRNLYQNAKSFVQNNDQQSDYFFCNVGVRQGENLSPVLFALYLNDFELFISKYYQGLTKLSESVKCHLSNNDVEVFFRLFCLLYADDTIVLAENNRDLQLALDALKLYCDRWKLTVNARKTKVVIFSKGKVRKRPVFKFDNVVLEIVDDYTYLGTVFNYNNKFNKAKKKQVNQARGALYSLLAKSYDLQLPLDIQLQLFDQIVLPVLLYGCEVWGFEDISQVESFHMKFCKKILKVHNYTANCMVYGELGRHRLIKTIEVRMVTFWARIVNGSKYKLSYTLYNLLRTLHEKGIYSSGWIIKVKSILDYSGMSYVWNFATNNNETLIDINWLKNSLNRRLSDMYEQDWLSEVFNNSQCKNYRIFKTKLELERYLVCLPIKDCINLCKFRCANHKLPVVTGRFLNITFNERICHYCSTEKLGDEFHYLFECNRFQKERKIFLKRFFTVNSNAIKMRQLFQTRKRSILRNLTKFVIVIMKSFS